MILTGFHLKLQVCHRVCWLKSLTLRFTASVLRLSTEAVRGNGKVEAVVLLGDRWVDTQTPMLTGKPKPRELRTGVTSVSLPAQMET